MHNANANIVFASSRCPFLPHTTANTSCMRTPLHTLPQIPIHFTAGTITKGDWGQAVFSTPQIPDRVSCSTNTTSPLVLCLLIPGIRRHGWVMTEMISPSSAPPKPPPTSPSIDLCLYQSGQLTSSVITV